MKVIANVAELKAYISEVKQQNKTVGFVPTMGALHEGHLNLVRKSVADNDISIVSVFVNPTQFNDKGDLDRYPRTLEKDSELLSSVGVDVVFAPSAEDMYSESEMREAFEFDFGGLDEVMEGKFRPNHFNGVVQVVSKLFTMVEPNKAYFGEKDFQQLAIIRRMVKVMGFDVEIVGCEITREESGLAMSSRNALLSEEEREVATNISRVLKESATFYSQTTVSELQAAAIAAINRHEALEVEYLDIVNAETMQSVETWDEAEHIVACVTVYCGKVRLIDNIKYK